VSEREWRIDAIRAKARRITVCPSCGLPVEKGELIGLVPSRGWCHVFCVVAEREVAGTVSSDDRSGGTAVLELVSDNLPVTHG
jgi:hypothetical protein